MELEPSAEVRRLVATLTLRSAPDFEAWESLLLQAARQGGAGVLDAGLRHWQQHAPREVIRSPCGQPRRGRGRRAKPLLTTLARVPFGRSFYQCRHCHQSRCPGDERLDIVQTTDSPGVRRLMARAGSQSPFAQAAEDLRCDASRRVAPREIERVAEAVGRQGEQWLPASAKAGKSLLKELGYFENNAPQMRYAESRQNQCFVGSGVVEARGRTVVGQRLKLPGMRGSVRGAHAIIALRCCILSNRFEDF